MAPRIEESAYADLLVFAECHGNRLRSGLQDQLYGVTFECDFPAEARNKPKVVRSLFENIDSPLHLLYVSA
jgi:hypothetical protein